jgi:Protein phosphatase 2C
MARSHENGRWTVRGVSVTGYSHLRDGIECQDAHRHLHEPSTGAYVLAVADGAGSRPRSAEGAALAVGLTVEEFGRRLARGGLPDDSEAWTLLLESGFEAIVEAFRETTRRLGGSPADFAATLTVAIIAPSWLGIVSLGDGIVVAGAEQFEHESGLHLVMAAPSAGEYVNETCFLSSDGAYDKVEVRCLHDPGLVALLLGTDGVTPLAVMRDGGAPRPNRTFVEPVLRSLAARSDPAEVSRLLLEERLTRLSADDKTLLAAVKT